MDQGHGSQLCEIAQKEKKRERQFTAFRSYREEENRNMNKPLNCLSG